MAIKEIVLSLVAIMFLSQNVYGFPRDASFVVIDDLKANENTSPKINLDNTVQETSSDVPQAQGATHRVSCDNQYEEPTEDFICQEHCLPKGYSYGLCINKTCSCI